MFGHAARICWSERAYRAFVRFLSSMTSQVDSIVVRSHNLLNNYYDRSYDCCQYWYPRSYIKPERNFNLPTILICMCFLYSDTCGLISNQEIQEVGQKFIRIKCKNGNCICLSQHQCYDVNAFCSAMYIRNNALRF